MSENRHIRRRIAWGRARARAHFRFRAPYLLVAFFGLIAVALQSLVVQIHIHVQQPVVRAHAMGIIAADSIADSQAASGQAGAPVDKYPINRDPANCPLCKELTHSGQYVSSASVLATLPVTVTVNFIVFREIAPSLFAASHNWRGRAPPLA
jgi:hypothetical protein